jgi:hypothetical protein
VIGLPAFLMDDADSRWMDAVTSLLGSVGYAATARWQLALVATALGREDQTFARSWTLTRGATLPLFAGVLACELPFSAMDYAFEGFAFDFGEEDANRSLMLGIDMIPAYLSSVVIGAFLGFAYLHFAGGGAREPDVASHVS